MKRKIVLSVMFMQYRGDQNCLRLWVCLLIDLKLMLNDSYMKIIGCDFVTGVCCGRMHSIVSPTGERVESSLY